MFQLYSAIQETNPVAESSNYTNKGKEEGRDGGEKKIYIYIFKSLLNICDRSR